MLCEVNRKNTKGHLRIIEALLSTVPAEVFSVFCEGWIVSLFIQAHNLSFWVGVTIRAVTPPNVDLVLCGLLVDRVVEVNGVGVFQPVVLPKQQGTNNHQANDGYQR